jgi:hypothetical protein
MQKGTHVSCRATEEARNRAYLIGMFTSALAAEAVGVARGASG